MKSVLVLLEKLMRNTAAAESEVANCIGLVRSASAELQYEGHTLEADGLMDLVQVALDLSRSIIDCWAIRCLG